MRIRYICADNDQPLEVDIVDDTEAWPTLKPTTV